MSKIHIRYFVASFVVSIAILTWSRYYSINSDGLQYIGIARLIKLGAWYDAVNGHWGPLISWLIASFSTLLPELFATRLIIALSSLLIPLVSWFIVKTFIQDKGLRYIAIISIMFMPLIMNTTAVVTPDTLLTFISLLGFYFGIRFVRSPDYKTAAMLGLLWAFAYYAKPFGFPFAIVFMFLLWRISSMPYEHKTIIIVSKPLVLGFFIFGFTTLPWLLALHHKYDHWMASSASRFNLFYRGPYPQIDDPLKQYDVPRLASQTFTQDNKMGGYYDPCPPGDALFTYSILEMNHYLQLKTFLANLGFLPKVFWGMFGFASFPILIGLVFSSFIPIKEKQFQLISSSCILWVLMYCAILLQGRYLMPIAPLIVIIACRGYEIAYAKIKRSGSNPSKHKYQQILSTLLLVQLIALPVWGISRLAHYVRCQKVTCGHVAIARDLAEIEDIEKLAQTYSCGDTIRYLAYVGDIPYAGAIVLEQYKKEDRLKIIKNANISHIVATCGELDESEIEGFHLVYKFSTGDKSFLVYKVLYDN